MRGMRRPFTMLGRVLTRGLRNLFRNAWLSTAAVAIMFVTLSIVSIGTVLSLSLNETIDNLTKEVSFEVYLTETVNPDKQNALRLALSNDDNVQQINFISKDQAKADCIEQGICSEEVLATLDENPIPASYRIRVSDLTEVDSIIAISQDPLFADIVEDINFKDDKKESIERIAAWQDYIITGSIGAAALFATIAMLIIFNTIRMAIYTRSDEIEIMKLIGATPVYIRGPFIVEAALYGIVAGMFTSGLFVATVNYLAGEGQTFLTFDRTGSYIQANWPAMIAMIIVLGALIGILSSMTALGKYLRLRKW